MTAGRPLKFQSVEELNNKIDDYFAKCKKDKDLPTITGLAVHLDTNRQTLQNYKERPEFFDSIKRAVERCEKALTEGALRNKLNSAVSIFVMKNCYGYKDKQEQKIEGNMDLNVNVRIDDGKD